MPSRRTLALISTMIVMGFVSALIVLSMYGGVDNYEPTTTKPEVIFREACARCHGPAGVGGDGIGPLLAGKRESPEEVKEHIQEGIGRMPRFPNIRGQALDNLARHVQALPRATLAAPE